MRYRRKPTEIEAHQYKEYGKLVKGMCNSRSCYSSGNTKPHVHTINGIELLEVGDFIITDIDGVHFYTCNQLDFMADYEPVLPMPPSPPPDRIYKHSWTTDPPPNYYKQ